MHTLAWSGVEAYTLEADGARPWRSPSAPSSVVLAEGESSEARRGFRSPGFFWAAGDEPPLFDSFPRPFAT